MFYEKFWHITIHQMLRKIEHLYRERTALQWRQGGQTFTVTYGKLMEDVWRLAARFQALGLKAQPLVIDGRNTYEQVVAFLAGVAMGAIVAPLSFDLPLENLRDLIARVQPAALVYDQEDRDILTGVTAGCMPVLIPCTDGADSVSVTLSGNGPLYEGDESLSPEAPVLLLATSGSTRRSKLVLLSHYALLPHSELETQRSLFVLPMYHIAGLNSLMNDLARGIPICLSTLGRGILDMAWFQPKDIFAVPSFVELLVQRAKAGKVDLGNLSSLISGGRPRAARPRNTWKVWEFIPYPFTALQRQPALWTIRCPPVFAGGLWECRAPGMTSGSLPREKCWSRALRSCCATWMIRRLRHRRW